MELTVEECLQKDQTHKIEFKADGYANDKTEIGIYTQCECQCSNIKISKSEAKNNCETCNGNGVYNCGICECNKGYGGECCACDVNSIEDYKALEKQCRRPGSLQICSERGDCICGKCHCKNIEGSTKQIQGKHCHCDNMSCPRKNNQFCNGKGTCNCGKCECNKGWKGEDCGCMTDVSPCIKDGVMCNNSGYCECGECQCQKTREFEYIGKYCQNAITSCDNYKDAVIYQAIENTPTLSWLEGIETEKDPDPKLLMTTIDDDDDKTAKKPSVSRVKDIEKIYEFEAVKTISKDTNCRALLEDFANPEYEDCWIQYSYEITEKTVVDSRSNVTTYSKGIRIEYGLGV